MFFSREQNRHKRWYHPLSLGRRKIRLLMMIGVFFVVILLTVLIVYSVRAAGYAPERLISSLPGCTLYDNNQHPVATLTPHDNAPVTWAELPPHLVEAFLAREDEHFFEHHGVVYSALVRSAMRNLLSMSYKQGASTITMQLTRHVFDLQGKTIDRKLLEIMLAQRLENRYDKATLLCQYLSRIYFGQNCYGLREAARTYFGKEIKELNTAESALLAGIVRAPSLINPVRNAERAVKARDETLQRMRELNYISQTEYEQAVKEPVSSTQPVAQRTDEPLIYPAMWANAELDLLPGIARERGHGLSVVSFLQEPIQQYLERAARETLNILENPEAPYPAAWAAKGDAEKISQKNFAATKRPANLQRGNAPTQSGKIKLQICALVIDARLNHRGNVLAVTCGRDSADNINYWLDEILPGRIVAPFIFYSACLPGRNEQHIVAHSARITGSRLGYDAVSNALNSLLPGGVELPDKENEQALYDGLFRVRKIDMARLLFALQNAGRNYPLRLVSTVWSNGQRLIYAADRDTPPRELLRREGAVAVSHLPPFRYSEELPVTLHEELPGNGGYWSMVCNDRGVTVILWCGALDAAGKPAETTPPFRKLLSHATRSLAEDLHSAARRMLREATKSHD